MLRSLSWFEMVSSHSFRSIIILSMLWIACNAALVADSASPALSPDFCFNTVSNIKKSSPNDRRFLNVTSADGKPHLAMSVPDCTKTCGPHPSAYNIQDMQQRLNEWTVPLVVLIGTMMFPRLGFWNSVLTVIHLLVDPFTTGRSLLSKLASNQQYYIQCQNIKLSRDVRRAMAIILATYEEWGNCLVEIQIEKQMQREKDSGDPELSGGQETWAAPQPLERLEELLVYQSSTTKTDLTDLNTRTSVACQEACLQAAQALSDGRANGLWSAILGTTTYVVAFFVSFHRINLGQFNRRTSGSIALALIMTWIIPDVLLSATVGHFNSKRLSRGTLARLEHDLDRIQQGAYKEKRILLQQLRNKLRNEYDKQLNIGEISPPPWKFKLDLLTEMQRDTYNKRGNVLNKLRIDIDELGRQAPDSPRETLDQLLGELDKLLEGGGNAEDNTPMKSHIFHFECLKDGGSNEEEYAPLKWSGGNYTFRPSRICGGGQYNNNIFLCLAVLPAFASLLSCLSIIWPIPPLGFSWRTVKNICLFVTWSMSFGLTELLSRNATLRQHWHRTCIKNCIILFVLTSAEVSTSTGVLNSCFGWSNYLSWSRGPAYVIFDPSPEIRKAARFMWPMNAGSLLVFHVVYYVSIVAWFWKGARLYEPFTTRRGQRAGSRKGALQS